MKRSYKFASVCLLVSLAVFAVSVAKVNAQTVIAIESSPTTVCAIIGTDSKSKTGGLKCWGSNTYGQIGDGSYGTLQDGAIDGITPANVDRFTATDVFGLTSGVSAVSIGAAHTCAITTAGGVQCWGDNSVGNLGDGTTTSRYTPVDVSGLTSGVIAIASGYSHTCALMSSGGVKCWGYNSTGQLGDGTTTTRYTPVDVSGLTSGVIAIAAGSSHTCAVTISGGVKCWGYRGFGVLGDGATAGWSTTPIDVKNAADGSLLTGVIAIDSMGNHTCAVTSARGVKCWGNNSKGRLGDGTTTDRSIAIDVLTSEERLPLTGVTAISTGQDHTCALMTNAGMKCWGDNSEGTLGDGTQESRTSPVDVITAHGGPLLTGVSAISAGSSNHTCAAMKLSGGVKCWGGNDSEGSVGNGSSSGSGITGGSPLNNVIGLTGLDTVAIGTDHTCAITTAGGVKCWGSNQYSQLGNSATTVTSTPVAVSGLSSGVRTIEAGDYHTCALTTAGGVICWGKNFGTTPVPILERDVLAITAGSSHSCALMMTPIGEAGGKVKCWGKNDFGQLGNGATTDSSAPVDALIQEVVDISAGGDHTCVLTLSPHQLGAKCWGRNNFGQIGDGTSISRSTPVGVSDRTRNITGALSAGNDHTCITTAGVTCWGGNFGPTPVDISGFVQGVTGTIPAKEGYNCTITSGGVLCLDEGYGGGSDLHQHCQGRW